MKINRIRIFALFITTTLILTSSIIMVYQVPNINQNEATNEVLEEPLDMRIKRGTRSGTAWPFYRNDVPNLGFSTSSVPDNNSVLWSNTTGGGDAYGSPVVSDGRVFVGSADGYLYCFSLYTGERLWRTYISSSDFGIASTPAVANDHVVIFCSGDDALHRLRVSDGGINWSYDPGGGAYGGSSPAIANGRIYFGSGNRYLYCIDEISGTLIWSYQTDFGPVRNYGIQSSPAVANGRVFVGACDGYIYAFNESQPSAPSADYFWRKNLFDAVFASPAVAYGRVYVGSGYYNYGEGVGSHTMFCLDELTGLEIWSFTTFSDILSSPAVAYDRVYFTSTDGQLYCVDANSSGPTPAMYWSNTTTDTWSSPSVADGKVIVGSRGNNQIYCFDAFDGTLLWNYNAGDDVYSSPAIADGKVLVSVRGFPETIYCFGFLSVTPTIDTIDIVSDSDNSGSPISNGPLDVGVEVIGYVAAYNDTYGYLYDIPVNWSYFNFGGANASTNPLLSSLSSTLYSGFFGGTVQWTADDGNGHSDTVTFTINSPVVVSIQIVDSPGTGSSQIAGSTVDVSYSKLGYSASFNGTIGYLGDVSVTWSVVNVSAQGYTTPSSGTNSTLNVGLLGGTVTWIADDGFGNTDSVTYNVNPPTVDYIIIRSGPNGTGSWVGDSTFIFGDNTTLYAAGYNNTADWISDVSATWDSNDTFIGDVIPGSGDSTTFFALNNGTCQVTATYNFLTNTTGILMVINYTIDYIVIRDAPNNQGNPIGDLNFSVGESVIFYAAAYNKSVGYLGDVPVDWLSSNSTVGTVTTPGPSSTFSAQSISGVCNVTASFGAFIFNTTGDLNVITATLDYIVITDSFDGNEIVSISLDVKQKITLYASGYNNTGIYIGPVFANWNQTPFSVGSFTSSIDSSTVFTAGISGGSTNIVTTNLSFGYSDEVPVTVNPPKIDYIQIRDEPNGQGNVVTSRTYSVYEVDGFYAAAYNHSVGFLYNILAAWSSNDTSVGEVSSPGINSTIRARWVNEESTFSVYANVTSQVFNSTGPFTVLPPTLDYIRIVDDDNHQLLEIKLDIGDSIEMYSFGYNATVGALSYVSVTWSLWPIIATISPSFGEDTNLTAESSGTTVLRAEYNAFIETTVPITVFDMISAPEGLEVTAVDGGGVLNLTWNASTEENLAGYYVYRSYSPGGDEFTRITQGLLTSPSYTDEPLANGVQHFYYVVAVDTKVRISEPSEIKSGIPDIDTDSDGIPNHADPDDDNDGLSDFDEALLKTDPLLIDTDGDNYTDLEDAYPLDPKKWETEPVEDFPFILLIILIIIVVVVLILFFFLMGRKKKDETPSPFEPESKLPPPPARLKKKEEEPIDEEKLPPPPARLQKKEEEPFDEDELPPPDDEDLPPSEDEDKPGPDTGESPQKDEEVEEPFDEDALPPPDD